MAKNTGIQKQNGKQLETVDEQAAVDVIVPGVRKAVTLGKQSPMTESQRKARGMKLEHFVSLENGDQVEGILLGRGGDALVNPRDPSKEGKQVLPTYRVQVSDTVVVRLLGSANLVGSLGGMDKGTHVRITRIGKDEKTNVTIFTVETGRTYDTNAPFPAEIFADVAN